MKFNKLNSDAIIDAVAIAAGLGLGVAASGALVAALPSDQKEVKQLGVGGLGIIGTALVKSKDTTGKVLKGFAGGMAAKQIYDLATDQLKKDVTVNTENPSLTDKLKAGALGLACPCNANLAAPTIDFPTDYDRVIDLDAQNNSQNREKILIA